MERKGKLGVQRSTKKRKDKMQSGKIMDIL